MNSSVKIALVGVQIGSLQYKWLRSCHWIERISGDRRENIKAIVTERYGSKMSGQQAPGNE